MNMSHKDGTDSFNKTPDGACLYVKLSLFFLRKDTSLSVDDLLGQYSAGVKRRCPEILPTAEPLTTHTSVSKEKGCDSTAGESCRRNRFATLLQWRNRSEEGTGEQGTRSRYKSMMGNLPRECILLLSQITPARP